MIYDNLILNKKLWSQLMMTWGKGKLPHSFLFYGPPGTGKEGHAVELAGLLCCEHPGADGPCGKCDGCKKVTSFQHGNVHPILPLPRAKSGLKKDDDPLKGLTEVQLENLRSQMNQKGRDPYFRIELENANTILINSIRELRRSIYMTTSEFGWKVILIFDAEKLCIPQPESANAVLKILEEPPNNTIFILVTSHIVQMLDTIRSRCQQIYFPHLSDQQIQTDLLNRNNSKQNSRIITQIANGDIRLARELAGSFSSITEAIEVLEKALYSANSDHWQNLISYLSSIKKQGSSAVENFFRSALLYFRDLLVLQQVGEQKIVIEQFRDKYKKIVAKFPAAQWEQLINETENAHRYLKANGYLPLIVSTWLLDLQSDLKGEGKLHFDLAEWQAS